MCGICGAVWTGAEHAVGENVLGRMTERLIHRGPDDAGTYRDAHAALGFRRLSIIDVAGSHQPLSNEDGSVWVVFNGEIYNYQALRHRLEARGHVLRTAGDTEVLVHLYEDEGAEGLFGLLRGMFALAIWDVRRKRLILGRDRLGQKPLVYRYEPGRLVFASEMKSLVEAGWTRRVDPVSVDRYLTYGYIPHPRTIYEGVHKLPPAHYGVWQDGRLSLHAYWAPEWGREVQRTEGEDVEELRALMTESVREQMVSDVSLGAFLSGGIDSTIVVGLMQKASARPVQTFSIGFDDPAFDETAYARLAAERLGTEHHAFVVQPRAWETVPKLAESLDEPFADSSALPTWLVSQETRAHVTVALTGDAGDELFGGYDRYRALAMTARLDALPEGVRRLIGGRLARAIPASSRAKTRLRGIRRLLEQVGRGVSERYLGWVTLFDEATRASLYTEDFVAGLARAESDPVEADPARVLGRAFDVAAERDPVTRAMVADLLTYLPGDLLFKVDMASMAHSLECRGPFLDHRVVELALAMPLERKVRLRGGRSKAVLKTAFADVLPEAIRHRPKMGFGVPLDRWFRGELAEEIRAVLLDPSAQGRGMFRPEAVERMVEEHVSGRRDHAYRLWGLMMLELWFRRYGEG
jgi:asparagine synthase (glutamine-hydrolysing)